MTSSGELVRQFCDAFARLDAEELIGYFAADAIYHNMPMPPLVGHAAIHGFFAAIPAQFLGLRFEILHLVEKGPVVMNERIDHFRLGDRTIALPVAGIFEIADGKIRAWRDYFDLATLENAMKQ
jgi:limonene-1,2-epoxide hydrolase